MYVRPEISKDKAWDILSRRKSFFPIGIRKRATPPKRIELIYLPYYLIEILLTGKAGEQKVTISVDGLLGNTMFFAGDRLVYQHEADGLVCDFVISAAEACKIATEEYKWLLLEHELRSRSKLTMKEITSVKRIFYPFWVGYFQKGKSYDFKALDGVSGEIQGVKMRRVFLKAFRQIG